MILKGLIFDFFFFIIWIRINNISLIFDWIYIDVEKNFFIYLIGVVLVFFLMYSSLVFCLILKFIVILYSI